MLFFFLPLCLPGKAAAPADSLGRLEADIRALISTNAAKDAVWSMSVRDESGSVVVDIDSRRMQRTASNSKLFVSAALLLELGPHFRYTTSIYGDGRISEDGNWLGDLHIIGSGDPSINGDFYDDDAFYVFDSFIEQLQQAGINAVYGDVFGNEALFDDQPYPRGWEWDDLSFYYAPELSALSFNRNCVDLSVDATGPVGDTPEIRWFPYNTDYVNFVNEQLITPDFMAY
ncbi:MAG: D-alanyl-D-alanine carboxypeptidase, partial [Cyclonatronaceae bacterium]